MKRIVWFARAGDIMRMGPYKSQLQAHKALTGHDGNPVAGAYVWCEVAK